MAKILGLDLGTNSIGWAVVDQDGKNFTLLDKGVRIFQEGVKIEKGVEGSKAAERTEFRSARRLKYRRKIRKINTLQVLSDFGYCPKVSKEELDLWRYKKVYPQNKELRNWWLTDDETEKHPYYFRNLAVTEKLDLSNEVDRFKIGRAFYHMSQRRGFLSNRLENTKESEGAVKKEIQEISKQKGDKTLGQYFYDLYTKGEKIRNHYTHRDDHYLEEFNRISVFQNLHDEFIQKLHKAIFYQRPLKSQKGLVGKCVFETNKSRCAVSRPEFEEYRMLCFINNIKIKTPDDSNLRFLTKDEVTKIVPRFFLQRDYFDFEDIAKQLAPKKQYKFYKDRNRNPEDYLFNYSMNTTVSGCPISARFKELFGDLFIDNNYSYVKDEFGKTPKIINDAWHVLYSFDSDDKLIEFATKKLQFNEEAAILFSKIKLKQDFAALSLKAINNILPYLRKGLIYSHAVFLASMYKVLPKEVWNNADNKKLIQQSVFDIISTQNAEKKIVDSVNALIQRCRKNNEFWSEEASDFYKNDLITKMKVEFGNDVYSSFSEAKKQEYETYAFTLFKDYLSKNMDKGVFVPLKRIDERVKDFLADNFHIEKESLKKLYHPSAIETYKSAIIGEDGKKYLGSPMISSIRNPMAMRALHQLRKVINELILNNIIDSSTKINIEMSRDLMNANERKAYQNWQRQQETKRKEYAAKIKEFYDEQNIQIEPSNDEILKYKLWEEQNHKCVYTGNEIAIHQFLGAQSSYDIEHTIPRSISYDNSQENKTLCENSFNRSEKRNKIPFELSNHKDILNRIEHWKENFEKLDAEIQRAVKQSKGATDKDSKDRAIQRRHLLTYERNYWKGKYNRFMMKEVSSGFKNSQLVDIGIITKYSRLFLKTVFDKVYTVKGSTVADFRKMWGLQDEYEKKARVNHIHHCIDAVTIACMTKSNYEVLAKYYHDREDAFIRNDDSKPKVNKPWETFTEDVKAIEKEVLISHHTPSVLPKQTKKKLRKRGKVVYKNGEPIYQQGDTVRGSLHKETYYGAIERTVTNKKGEEEKCIKYVVRKPLDQLEDSSVKNIVDKKIREIVSQARVQEKELTKQQDQIRKQLQKAEECEEEALKLKIAELDKEIQYLYSLPNKKGAPIPIKKIRIYTPTVTNPIHLKSQRDTCKTKSKPHKEKYYVTNGGNYSLAFYEGLDENGKQIRDFEIITNLQAGHYFKLSVQNVIKPLKNRYEGLIILDKKVPLKALLKIGTLVLFYKNNSKEIWDLDIQDINKRLYKIIGFEADGRIQFRYHEIAMQQSSLNKDEMTIVKYMKDNNLKNSKVNFETPIPWLRLRRGEWNFLINGIHFKINALGKIETIE
ncbi:MAG: type II CRISPR RNA-guided endonuclease Cas9 [bacterium]